MPTPSEKVAETIGLTDFTVSYEVSSTITVAASQDDFETFLRLQENPDELPYVALLHEFLAWCIEEDGFEFDERGPVKITGVTEANEVQAPPASP